MADDPKQRRPADAQRINVDQEYEVRYWTSELGCTEAELRAAVRAVGVMAEGVRKHLHNA